MEEQKTKQKHQVGLRVVSSFNSSKCHSNVIIRKSNSSSGRVERKKECRVKLYIGRWKVAFLLCLLLCLAFVEYNVNLIKAMGRGELKRGRLIDIGI